MKRLGTACTVSANSRSSSCIGAVARPRAFSSASTACSAVPASVIDSAAMAGLIQCLARWVRVERPFELDEDDVRVPVTSVEVVAVAAAKAQAWAALVHGRKLGYLALLRNVRNIMERTLLLAIHNNVPQRARQCDLYLEPPPWAGLGQTLYRPIR